MFKRKSFLFSMTLLLVLSMVLAACGPNREEVKQENGASNEGGEPAKPDELTVWAWDDVAEAYKDIAEKYTEKTGITVNVVAGDNQDISLDAPAGRGPDLFYGTHDRLGDIYLQGLAAELELTDEQLQGYQEAALESFSYEGKLLGVPSSVETIGLFYNTDLVPEAPQTIDDLMKAAESLTNPEKDEYGFLNMTSDFYPSFPFLIASGGYVFGKSEEGTYDTEDIGLATDDVVKGAEIIQALHENKYIPDSITYDVMNGLFRDGKVGAIISGPWSINDFQEGLGDKLAIAPLPSFEGEHLNSFLGVKGWLISEYSENKYWASDLALFMTNAENSKILFEEADRIPARTDIEIDNELYKGIQEQLEYAVPMPNIPEMAQVWEPMGNALVFISNGDDPKPVLEEAVKQIKEQIALLGSGNNN
ncbi:sugar ABC transporter substrate-binding protein [Bacillus taeanensis]|uniref:Maltodextrin-binding protein n=1 Tax=Bacillus taeanensis TaxID=273032 RepID=A0A366XPV9_9BACI|nr:extracellular solute-binding protein [Bacillus taeanensis]RBW68400.1 ABC transporter substrate-binding protein [Bacillus taeanensis]